MHVSISKDNPLVKFAYKYGELGYDPRPEVTVCWLIGGVFWGLVKLLLVFFSVFILGGYVADFIIWIAICTVSSTIVEPHMAAVLVLCTLGLILASAALWAIYALIKRVGLCFTVTLK